jgi:hypothetical protein
MSTTPGATEAMSPDGAIRVRVGSDGRTLWVGLSPAAMRSSAAELASSIVCTNVLAYMVFQVSQGCRTQNELDVYARFVASRCRDGLRQSPNDVVSGVKGAPRPPDQDHDELGQRVRARVKYIEALLAEAPANIEWIGGDRDVVVTADPCGWLSSLWLSPRCTTHYSVVELEGLLNRVLATVGVSPHPARNSLRDAS